MTRLKGELKKYHGIIWEYFPNIGREVASIPKLLVSYHVIFVMLNFYEVLKHVYNRGEMLSDQFDHLNVIEFWV